jgi:hypothetical protein
MQTLNLLYKNKNYLILKIKIIKYILNKILAAFALKRAKRSIINYKKVKFIFIRSLKAKLS